VKLFGDKILKEDFSVFKYQINNWQLGLIKDVFIDSKTFLYSSAGLTIFLSATLLINIFSHCLTVLIFTGFSLVSNRFVRKNLP